MKPQDKAKSSSKAKKSRPPGEADCPQPSVEENSVSAQDGKQVDTAEATEADAGKLPEKPVKVKPGKEKRKLKKLEAEAKRAEMAANGELPEHPVKTKPWLVQRELKRKAGEERRLARKAAKKLAIAPLEKAASEALAKARGGGEEAARSKKRTKKDKKAPGGSDADSPATETASSPLQPSVGTSGKSLSESESSVAEIVKIC